MFGCEDEETGFAAREVVRMGVRVVASGVEGGAVGEDVQGGREGSRAEGHDERCRGEFWDEAGCGVAAPVLGVDEGGVGFAV